MTLRRYAPMTRSAGIRIPASMRLRVLRRDERAAGGCVGFGRLPGDCMGGLELDHVRASGGLGMKSTTCDCNLVALCGAHHRHKTAHGRDDRPVLLDYLERFAYGPHEDGHVAEADCGHVDPEYGCLTCMTRRTAS